MEEILASIRRIISEDDAPAEAAAAPAVHHEPEPEPALHAAPDPVHEPVAHAPAFHEEEEDEDEDVLELNEHAPAPRFEAKETHGDLDVFTAPEPAPPPKPVEVPTYEAPKPSFPAYAEEDDSLVSSHAANASASHFGALTQNIGMAHSDQTLDGVVRELLRPLLKEWLDTHLTAIVEQTVQAEVERISRRRVY